MSADLNKIVDFFVAQVSTAGNLIRMEKKRLQILFEKSSHSVKNYIENWLTCSNYIKFKEKISWNITSVWCVALWKVSLKNLIWNHTKKESVNRQVNGLRQLLIIFGGVVLVQLAMRNWSGKNGLVYWTIFGVFTLGKMINYFTSVNTDYWPKNGDGSKPIHHHF